MFSVRFQRKISTIWATFELSSANAFSFDKPTILSFGNELKEHLHAL